MNERICPKCAGEMLFLSEVKADQPQDDRHGGDMSNQPHRHAHSLFHSLSHPTASTSTEYEQALESIEMADREAELIRKAHQLDPLDSIHDQGACWAGDSETLTDDIHKPSPVDRVSKDVDPSATLDGVTLFHKKLKEGYREDTLSCVPAERLSRVGFSAEAIIHRICYPRAKERQGRILWLFVSDESSVKNRIADLVKLIESLDGICPTFLVMIINGNHGVSTPINEENGVWQCDRKDADGLCVGLRNYFLGVLDSDSVVNNRRDLVVGELGLVSDKLFVNKIQSALHTYRRGIDAIEKQKQAMQKVWSDQETQLLNEFIDVIES